MYIWFLFIAKRIGNGNAKVIIMFITLKSTKRDIGLFNLEIADLIIGFFFSVVIAILFLIQKYRIGIIVGMIGFSGLIPICFSNKNRLYKIIFLLVKYFNRPRNYYFIKNDY